jgi:hypothetical protein
MEPLKTTITIKSIIPSDKVPVFNVETEEGERYQFWKTKKDGTNTVAFQQFSDKRFIGGDRLEIFYNETEGKPYQNTHTGKMVTSTNRIITKFIEDSEGNPTKPPQTQNLPPTMHETPKLVQSYTPSNIGALEAKIRTSFEIRDKTIQDLLDKVIKLEEQLGYFAFIFQQHNPDAFKVHSDMLPTPKEPPIPII